VIAKEIADAIEFAGRIEQATACVPFVRRIQKREVLRLPPGLDRLDRAFERLRGVQVEYDSTANLIRRYDFRRALFVCDERGTNWDAEKGLQIADALCGASGRVILIADDVPAELAKSNHSG
jgi:hypothetical protein